VPAAQAASMVDALSTGMFSSASALQAALSSAGVVGITAEAILTPPITAASPSPPPSASPSPPPTGGGLDSGNDALGDGDDDDSSGSGSTNTTLAVILAIVGVLFLVLLIGVIYYYCRVKGGTLAFKKVDKLANGGSGKYPSIVLKDRI